MARPAPSLRQPPEQAADAPPVDPLAVARAYRRERLRRRARQDRVRERRLAGLRFAFVLAALLALSVFLTLTAWHEVQRLFGL